MKKILFCTVLCILMWNQGYSADRTTKQYNFKDFKKVEISNGIQFNISQASSYSIVINADTQDFEYLKVEKERSTLRIYIDKNNYRKAGDIDIKIQMPELTGLDLSGGSNGEFTMNIKDNFSCEFSGGAQVNGNLSCQNANMEISGGSIVSLKGTGSDLTVDGSGGSVYHLKEFNVKNVNVDLSGGSQLEIKMNGTLNADASGGSKVIYYGTANMGSTDFSGGSGISQGK